MLPEGNTSVRENSVAVAVSAVKLVLWIVLVLSRTSHLLDAAMPNASTGDHRGREITFAVGGECVLGSAVTEFWERA